MFIHRSRSRSSHMISEVTHTHVVCFVYLAHRIAHLLHLPCHMLFNHLESSTIISEISTPRDTPTTHYHGALIYLPGSSIILPMLLCCFQYQHSKMTLLGCNDVVQKFHSYQLTCQLLSVQERHFTLQQHQSIAPFII